MNIQAGHFYFIKDEFFEEIKDNFIKFQNATSVYGSDIPIDDKYCISVKAKKRYIIPLTKYNNSVCRINEISKSAKNDIDEYFNIKHFKYTGFDFNFKPYERSVK